MRDRGIALGNAPLAAAGGVTEALGWVARLRRVANVVRTIVGAPDYDRYLTHMAAHHPGCEVVSRDEFMKQRLESRYSRPGSRCC